MRGKGFELICEITRWCRKSQINPFVHNGFENEQQTLFQLLKVNAVLFGVISTHVFFAAVQWMHMQHHKCILDCGGYPLNIDFCNSRHNSMHIQQQSNHKTKGKPETCKLMNKYSSFYSDENFATLLKVYNVAKKSETHRLDRGSKHPLNFIFYDYNFESSQGVVQQYLRTTTRLFLLGCLLYRALSKQ
jgi:hypothetical protein